MVDKCVAYINVSCGVHVAQDVHLITSLYNCTRMFSFVQSIIL